MRYLAFKVLPSITLTILAAGALAHSQSFPPGVTAVVGNVSTIDADSLTIQSAQGPVKVILNKGLVIYASAPSDLSHVSFKTFIGVTSVKGLDGKEHATEVHIFPEELRGVGEGSYMMGAAQPGKPSASRMTNGSVSDSRITSSSLSGSRMTNGAVVNGSSSELTVGGQHIYILKGTPVTLLAPTKQPLHQGSKVFVLAKKQANGIYTSDKIISAGS